MPCQEGNEGSKEYNYEERQAGDSGNMSHMWDQDVQDRESLKIPDLNIWKRLGVRTCTQPFYYDHTFWTFVT